MKRWRVVTEEGADGDEEAIAARAMVDVEVEGAHACRHRAVRVAICWQASPLLVCARVPQLGLGPCERYRHAGAIDEPQSVARVVAAHERVDQGVHIFLASEYVREI